MSITHNPYLQEAFEKHLLEKTAKAYCKSRGLSKSMAKAKAKKDLEKMANMSMMGKFFQGLGKSFAGLGDDIASGVKGATKTVATSADETTQAVANATKGTPAAAAKDVATQTQAMPKYVAPEGAGFMDKARIGAANFLQKDPRLVAGAAVGAVGATGLATGAMLS